MDQSVEGADKCLNWLYSKYPDVHPLPFYVNDRPRYRQDSTISLGHFFVSIVDGTVNMGDPCEDCGRVGPHAEVCMGRLPDGYVSGKLYRDTIQERVIEEFHHYRNSVRRARAARVRNRTRPSQINTSKLNMWEHDSHPEEVYTDRLVRNDFADYIKWEKSFGPRRKAC